jgi:hypothetical protein
MIPDLRAILDGWEYEAGRISVRKIIGRDGEEKIQTRIDMGVLQIELDGRPDGQEPHGHESYMDFLEQNLAKHAELYGDDDDFVLSPEDCQELRHEAYLYYQRYLSLFVLEDYERVIRDTERNLSVIDFCQEHAACHHDRVALAPQRAYVLMMNVRARAYQAVNEGDADAALAALDAGIASLRERRAADADERDEPAGESEVRILEDLRREVLEKLPAGAVARLEWELQTALACEDYHKAAELRDALAARQPG